jgi:acyl carrier protein phosphodiesterase
MIGCPRDMMIANDWHNEIRSDVHPQPRVEMLADWELLAKYRELVEGYELEILPDDDEWTFHFVNATPRRFVRVDYSDSGQTWINTYDTLDELVEVVELEEGWDVELVIDLVTGQQFALEATWSARPMP